MSAEKDCRLAVAFVPIMYKQSISVPSRILLYIIITPVIVLILIISAYLLKISRELKAFTIIRLLLGQSITQVPKKTAERIFFMTIVVLFSCFMQDLYSEIAKINFGFKEVEFNSLKALGKSLFHLYTIFNFN